MSQAQKVRLCARFLEKCLRIGWTEDELEFLHDLWWKHEAWQFHKE